MFPSLNSSSPVPNPLQRPSVASSHNGTQPHSHQIPQHIPQPQIEPIVYKPSAELKRLKTINKWHFLIVNFSIGVAIVNLVRLSKPHIFLGVVVLIAGSVSLFIISPTDSRYVGLWRTGGAALAFGGILCFWDLYHLLTWQHYLAIAFVVIVAMWIIGAGSD
ncbi:hypothetical protein [Microcoleus sp. B3-D7]|uniref:hypothetical protein n=1 Tax=Microcoleus sp. B3-D7 TaxID=2818659 RepID=UPI002FCFA2CD